MKLPELIERLTRMQDHLNARGIDVANSPVVLWDGSGDETTPVTGIDYDRFEDDEPWVVIVQKAGDP